MPTSTSRVAVLTAAAMAAFAANSLLTRAALGTGAIDAASFTAIRLASGAAALLLIARGRSAVGSGSWTSALALFAYAAPFSFAYLRIGAALGALVLFAAVQVTMIGWALIRGERPTALGWLGIAGAVGGLVMLTAPGSAAGDPAGIVLMSVAGIAWGVYSIRGRSVTRPLRATTDNFLRSLPFAALLLVYVSFRSHWSVTGVALAAASGAIASGVGYAIWYSALPGLGPTRGAVVQLSVPVITAAGGIIFLGEPVTLRWAVSALAILGGIALVIRGAGNVGVRGRSRAR